MLKVLLAVLLVALPMVASAAEETVVSSSDPAPKSWLAPDIFHVLAHSCNIPSLTCGPDNLVTNAFGALIRIWVPVTQNYDRFFIFTDTEGNVRLPVFGFSGVLPGPGFSTIFVSGVSLPDSSNVATRGLYKFISVIIAADGRTAFSDYYRFRVLP